MLTLLHYVPHLIFSGLILLALFAMFSDDGSKLVVATDDKVIVFAIKPSSPR